MGKKMREKIKEYMSRLEDEIRALTPADLEQFLRFRRYFRNYSIFNTMLIYMQRPNATLVAGMKKWNSLGRKVRKGERAIWIFVPWFKKIEVDVESETDSDSGKEETKVEEVLKGFIMRPVWDVSQTEGEPLPEDLAPLPAPEVKGNVSLEELYHKLIDTSPVPVKETSLPYHEYGFAVVKGERHIQINTAHDIKTRIVTLFHELAHIETPEKVEGKEEKDVIAETVAYILAGMYGIDNLKGSAVYLGRFESRPIEFMEYVVGIVERISDRIGNMADYRIVENF